MKKAPYSTRRRFIAQGAGVCGGGIVGGLPLVALGQGKKKADKVMRYYDAKLYDVTHSVDIKNGDVKLHSLEAWLPVPQDYPEQKVTGFKSKPDVPILVDKRTNIKVGALFLKKSKVPGPQESLTFELGYRIASSKAEADAKKLGAVKYKPYFQDRYHRIYIRPEKRIQTHHLAIRKLALEFKGKRRSSVHVARLIYDFIIERTEIRSISGVQGSALYCLENKNGACTEYSALFVALCRAAGVPARPVAGCWADKKNGWHVWSEFMLPTGEWIGVDANMGDTVKAKADYYFGNLENNRVAMCKSFDVRLPQNRGGQKYIDILHFGALWWTTKASVVPKYPSSNHRVNGVAVEE